MARKRKYSKRSGQGLPKILLLQLWFFTLIVLVFYFTILRFTQIVIALNRNPEYLPVLNIRTISSPEPLILSKTSTSILGFGTFDPFDVIKSVNDERIKTGSKPLRANDTLMRAAAMRADAILKNENFSHQDPFTNIELGTVLPKLNYHFIYASENIGMGGNSGRDFVDGFMHSTSHRINLLDPKLTDTGVAVIDGPFDRYYVNIVVQIFAIPGGKEEYLGYNDSDKRFYETQLSSLTTKLDPLTWFFLRVGNGKQYTEDYHTKLVKQKDLLWAVVEVMKRSEPLETNHVAAIREYNKVIASLK